MNVVPAQTAGVDSLVIASPPQAPTFDGLPHPTILAAAALLGVDEVWAVGGAQAVALLAYGGTDTDGAELAPVDMITGPGNIYVTAAKRICRSQVGIDAEAGPTEIAILADHTADPAHVAADLISQAEHDEMAASVLVTPSAELADATDAELAAQLADHRAPRAGDRGADGAAVGDRAGRRPRRRGRDGQRLRRRAPGDPDRRRAAGREPDPFCRRDLRRAVVAGEPRRLLRRLQPRAADRGLRAALQRAVGADVPARHPRRRLHRGGAEGRVRARDHAGRGRETCPRTARRYGGGSSDERSRTARALDTGRSAAARRPARQIALRRTATGGSGAAEHQREPAPAHPGAGRRRRARRCATRPPTCTATPTATRWPCAPTWPPT